MVSVQCFECVATTLFVGHCVGSVPPVEIAQEFLALRATLLRGFQVQFHFCVGHVFNVTISTCNFVPLGDWIALGDFSFIVFFAIP